MADTQEAASSGLFGVFLLSIYSLFLIPYTIYYLCSAGEEATTQPVAKVGSCLPAWMHDHCHQLLLDPNVHLDAWYRGRRNKDSQTD